MSELNSYYNSIISEKDQLITDLTNQLESVKKELTDSITERNINKELENFRKDFTRFGIDFYFIGGIPIGDWINNRKIDTNFNSYAFGIGLNAMLIKKVNLRGTLGIEYRNSVVNPQLGFSVGYFF